MQQQSPKKHQQVANCKLTCILTAAAIGLGQQKAQKKGFWEASLSFNNANSDNSKSNLILAYNQECAPLFDGFKATQQAAWHF